MCLLFGTPTTYMVLNSSKARGEQDSFRVETQSRCHYLNCVTLRPRHL